MDEEELSERVLLIGPKGCGKTSLLRAFRRLPFNPSQRSSRFPSSHTVTAPSIAVDLSSVEITVSDHVGRSKLITLQLFDCSGDPRFDSIAQTFYRNTKLLLFVIDATNELECLTFTQRRLDQVKETVSPDDLPGLLLIRTKCDLLDDPHVSPLEELSSYVEENDLVCISDVSAVTGSNVRACFEGYFNGSLPPPGEISSGPLDCGFETSSTSTVDYSNWWGLILKREEVLSTQARLVVMRESQLAIDPSIVPNRLVLNSVNHTVAICGFWSRVSTILIYEVLPDPLEATDVVFFYRFPLSFHSFPFSVRVVCKNLAGDVVEVLESSVSASGASLKNSEIGASEFRIGVLPTCAEISVEATWVRELDVRVLSDQSQLCLDLPSVTVDGRAVVCHSNDVVSLDATLEIPSIETTCVKFGLLSEDDSVGAGQQHRIWRRLSVRNGLTIDLILESAAPEEPTLVVEDLPSPLVLGDEVYRTAGCLYFIPAASSSSDNSLPDLSDLETLQDGKYEVDFLVDCSIAMSGERIKHTRDALRVVLRSFDSFRAVFRVNLICFGSECLPLFDRPATLTPETFKLIDEKLSSMTANLGGCDLLDSLHFVLSPATPRGYQHIVLLISDFNVPDSRAVVSSVAARARPLRLFSYYFGESDVSLFSSLASETGGLSCRMTDVDSVRHCILSSLPSMFTSPVGDFAFRCDDDEEEEEEEMPLRMIETTNSLVKWSWNSRFFLSTKRPSSGSCLYRCDAEQNHSGFATCSVLDNETGLSQLVGLSLLREGNEVDPETIIAVSDSLGLVSSRTTLILSSSSSSSSDSHPSSSSSLLSDCTWSLTPIAESIPFRNPQGHRSVAPYSYFQPRPHAAAAASPGVARVRESEGDAARANSCSGNTAAAPIDRRGFSRAVSSIYDDMEKDLADVQEEDVFPEPKTSEERLNILLLSQQFDGNWKPLRSICLACGISMMELKDACPRNIKLSDCEAWVTAVVVSVIREDFSEREDEWRFVVLKGTSWLERSGFGSILETAEEFVGAGREGLE